MPEDKGLIGRLVEGISGASTPLKGAWDTAKEINSMNVAYSVKEKTAELLDKLVDARGSSLQLADLLREAKDRIVELEKEINDREQWLDEKSAYELYQPDIGTVVYRLKSPDGTEQSPHYFCTNCYESHVISTLQKQKGGGMYQVMMVCHKCSASYLFSHESLGLKKQQTDKMANADYNLFGD